MRARLLLLSLCIVFLQLHTAEVARGEAAGEEEDNINPFELARQLRAEICAINKSQIKEFYKTQRDEENRDMQFPEAPGKPLSSEWKLAAGGTPGFLHKS